MQEAIKLQLAAKGWHSTANALYLVHYQWQSRQKLTRTTAEYLGHFSFHDQQCHSLAQLSTIKASILE
jgi:hypothetical protein